MEFQTMDQNGQAQSNPLQKYFRQPGVYIKLPSEGEFWPPNSLNLPANGEIPVYPLTTRDEIALRTPDALMNGAGVADVIQSCCPNILDAWKMPTIDVDAVLIAIRIASYGHMMDFDMNCPYCNAENSFQQDLRDNLAAIKKPDYKKTITTENLIIKLRPAAYFEANKTGQINFEEQKLMQAVENTDLDPGVRNLQISQSTKRLVEIGLDNLTAVTDYIATDEGDVVKDPKFIRDFYVNASSSTVKLINEQLEAFTKEYSQKTLLANCTSCSKDFEVPIEFNYTNFFDKGF
jgi:hypothetical protein